MSAMTRKLLTAAVLGACAALSGCEMARVDQDFTSTSQAAVGRPVVFAFSPLVALTANATLMPCSGPTCTWTAPDGTRRTSTVHLTCSTCQEAALAASAVDVVIVQAHQEATGITGTYDDGHGLTGPLQITSGFSSLPVDGQSALVAEPGMQLVVVELPAGAPRTTYTFNFQMSEFPPNVKALFAAKVKVASTTYYAPLLPCTSDMPSVPAFEFTVMTSPLLTPAYLALVQGCSNKVYTFPAAGLDLNQHGLTGSWFKQASSGQGAEVEVFQDHEAPGTGDAFVSWFTYDTVAGGADHQRWYTAQGQVVTGQPSAALTIYQNTGGNFNGPPVTMAQPVGTATLSFDTCTSGRFSYNFTDGTGRAGTIPLTRLTQNVTCSAAKPYPTNADFALSGNWFGGAATSGQGFTAEVNPINGAFFSAWYTYMPNGTMAGAAGQRWYTAQGAFMPGMRSIPVTIYETTGGIFDTPTPLGQKTVPVGTGTMAFQSCTAATFSYTFTGGTSVGLSSTINLVRVGPVPPGCTS